MKHVMPKTQKVILQHLLITINLMKNLWTSLKSSLIPP